MWGWWVIGGFILLIFLTFLGITGKLTKAISAGDDFTSSVFTTSARNVAVQREEYPPAAREVLKEIQSLKNSFLGYALLASQVAVARASGDETEAKINEAKMGFERREMIAAQQRANEVAQMIRELPPSTSRFEAAHRELIDASIYLSHVSRIGSWTLMSPPSVATIGEMTPDMKQLTDSIKRLDLLLPK